MRKPVIIAHRGASAIAPENTMAAFREALNMHAGGIELDVQLSRDGHPVIIHDEKINRTSNGKGYVKDFTLEQLKQLDFGGWFNTSFSNEKIPTLEEVLKLLEAWDGILNIELKNSVIFYDGIEKKTLDMVKEYKMLDRVILSSFNHNSLAGVKKLEPCAKTGVLYMKGLNEPWVYAKKLGAFAIHPLFYNITPKIMAGCKRHGIKVNTFTVDKPVHLAAIANAGVDGIITNVPDVAFDVLQLKGRG